MKWILLLLISLSAHAEFFTKYDLVKRWDFEPATIENELGNGFRLLKLNRDNELRLSVIEFATEMYDEKSGLVKNHIDPEVYARHPDISHDQLTFMVCIYDYLNLKDNIAKKIWDKTKYYHYDGRLLNLRDWVFYGVMADSWIAKLHYPVLYLSAIYSFVMKYDYRFKFDHETHMHKIYEFKIMKRTSGPMLWVDRIEALDDPLLSWLVGKLINYQFGSLEELYAAYYHQPNHPIRSKELWD